VARSRGQRCGGIELTAYLAKAAGPVPLVLDLRITHERFGSSSDPSINGHLQYPNDLDGPLNEVTGSDLDQFHLHRAAFSLQLESGQRPREGCSFTE